MQARPEKLGAVPIADLAATVRKPSDLLSGPANESKIVLSHVRCHEG